jgi:hypothetical protein
MSMRGCRGHALQDRRQTSLCANARLGTTETGRCARFVLRGLTVFQVVSYNKAELIDSYGTLLCSFICVLDASVQILKG